MTTLVVEELQTTLSQEFTISRSKRYHISGLKMYLVMYNAPSGTFTATIKSGATTIASKSFTSGDIQSDLSTSDSYAHVWKALVFDNNVILDKGTYTLELSSSGYTFSESAYMGWVKEHDQIFFGTDYTVNNIWEYPLSFYLLDETEIGE